MTDKTIVSERGTITIPARIRNLAHIRPGDLIELNTEKDRIILTHMIVRHPDEESSLNENEWHRFDKLVQNQLKKGQYKSYSNLTKAKLHSRTLIRK